MKKKAVKSHKKNYLKEMLLAIKTSEVRFCVGMNFPTPHASRVNHTRVPLERPPCVLFHVYRYSKGSCKPRYQVGFKHIVIGLSVAEHAKRVFISENKEATPACILALHQCSSAQKL